MKKKIKSKAVNYFVSYSHSAGFGRAFLTSNSGYLDLSNAERNGLYSVCVLNYKVNPE